MGIIGKLKVFMDNPEYFLTSPAAKGYLDWVPDGLYLKTLYKIKLKRKCNLKNPVLYNEKLQWLKIHDRKPEYAQLVDKWEVRKYIADTFGEEYLIPAIGVYNSCDEIDFDSLPNEFVMKCTHDSGSVEICTNKATWDKDKACANISAALKRNYYKAYREWPYKTVKPRIIIENYMHDIASDDLKDYKVMCFNGKAKIIEVHENRFNEEREHTQTFYTDKWEKLEISQPFSYPTKEDREKPALLDKMIELSEKIAADMYHVRVDWYVVNEVLLFGEITFFDGSGFEPFTKLEYEKYLGDLMVLD